MRDEEGNRLLRTDSIRELYDFAEVVGEGGFGTVLRARHRRTGEVVAIKSIAKSQLKDEEALQLEVAFLKMSDHPNTVRYYETFEDAHDIHLVMEMCSGEVHWTPELFYVYIFSCRDSAEGFEESTTKNPRNK